MLYKIDKITDGNNNKSYDLYTRVREKDDWQRVRVSFANLEEAQYFVKGMKTTQITVESGEY